MKTFNFYTFKLQFLQSKAKRSGGNDKEIIIITESDHKWLFQLSFPVFFPPSLP